MVLHSARKKKRDEEFCESSNNYKIATLILALLLVLSILANILLISGEDNEKGEVMYMNPVRCLGNCEGTKDVVSATAKRAGLDFRQLNSEQSSFPQYILIYNNSVLISRYINERTFNMQVCGFTNIDKVCPQTG